MKTAILDNGIAITETGQTCLVDFWDGEAFKADPFDVDGYGLTSDDVDDPIIVLFGGWLYANAIIQYKGTTVWNGEYPGNDGLRAIATQICNIDGEPVDVARFDCCEKRWVEKNS